VLIKRLQIDPARGKVIVSCDNRDYPPLPPVDADDVNVEGRVIWVGRRV
jgi:phage repressor protein C with HTH and peptisase S24 domain